MMALIKAIFYTPLYNLFVVFLSIPGIDAGMAVILITATVRLVLFPLSKKALQSQIQMKLIEPDLKKIQEDFKDNPQEKGLRTMQLYKQNGINPFSSILILLIQIPIIFSLYHIFQSGAVSHINETLLYPFVSVPTTVKATFLGLIPLLSKNVFVALCAGITQYIQATLQPLPVSTKKDGAKRSFQDDFSRSMNLQIKYILPIMVFFFSFTLPALFGLYWTTSNIFTIIQELFLRKDRKHLQSLHS